MGNTLSSMKKVNFEDIQLICKNLKPFTLMINTLELNEQKCLIKNTLLASDEERTINDLINKKTYDIHIIIYGKNNNENDKLLQKYKQFVNLGFKNIYIYQGGLFEWLLLQDIYGDEEFQTTIKEYDILKYKPSSLFLNNNLLTYG